jgi:hypothetical protein
VVLAAVLFISGCGAKSAEQSGADLQPEFLTSVAAAEEAGLMVHWLGDAFDVEGMRFRSGSAKFPEGILGVGLEGIEIYYLMDPSEGGTSLGLQVFPRSEWVKVEQKVRNLTIPGEPQPVTRRTVDVQSRKAELLSLPLGTREVNQLWLILELDDTVVVAQAHSGGPIYAGGPDYNPFINNPDLLVQVIDENLRPYPE